MPNDITDNNIRANKLTSNVHIVYSGIRKLYNDITCSLTITFNYCTYSQKPGHKTQTI